MIEIEHLESPLSKKDIKQFEEIKKVSLSKEYKEFLFKYNGGKPKSMRSFFLKNGNPGSSVDNFLGIKHTLELQSMDYILRVFGERVPKDLLPIARDPYGNLICICVVEKNYGKIYFWDHENEIMDLKKEPWWDNIYLVADSFNEFIDNLYKFDIDDDGNQIRTYQDGRVEVTKLTEI
jgi:SMI1-KNR4 cell-wall